MQCQAKSHGGELAKSAERLWEDGLTSELDRAGSGEAGVLVLLTPELVVETALQGASGISYRCSSPPCTVQGLPVPLKLSPTRTQREWKCTRSFCSKDEKVSEDDMGRVMTACAIGGCICWDEIKTQTWKMRSWMKSFPKEGIVCRKLLKLAKTRRV